MRDELENVAELLAVVEAGGDELVVHATEPGEEDMFGLGADLPGTLRRKMAVMRAHWRDVERYLAPPHM